MAKKQIGKMSEALKAAQEARKVESARRGKLSPDARFKEDCGNKVDTVLKSLGSIGRFPSRTTDADGKAYYTYTPAMVEKMFAAIRAEVDRAESRYLVKQEGKKRGDTGFNF